MLTLVLLCDFVQEKLNMSAHQQANISKHIRVDLETISDQDTVLFIRRVTAEGQVVFEAVCATRGYYLHQNCVDADSAKQDFLVGQVFLVEEEERVVWATIGG